MSKSCVPYRLLLFVLHIRAFQPVYVNAKAVNAKGVLLLLLVLAMGIVQADDTSSSSRGNLIIGTASIPDYVGSDEYQLVPMIISNFSLSGIDFVFEGTGARIDVNKHPVFEAGPVLNLALPRQDLSSEPVSRVGEFDADLEAGGYVGFAAPFSNRPEGELSGYLLLKSTILGEQEGTQLVGQMEYFFALKRFLRLGFSASVTAGDNQYMNMHFGVDQAASARSGLQQFEARSGLRDVSLSAYSVFSFSRRWGVFGRVLASRLLDDAADSPLVREEGSVYQYFSGLGLFVNFY